MHFCPIVPIPHLDLAKNAQYHLALYSLLKDSNYREFYRREAAQGKVVMLDNDAYENGASTTDHHHLLDTALELGFKELVVPDVLQNRIETNRTSYAAIRVWQSRISDIVSCGLKLVLVPQSTSFPGWEFSMRDLFSIYASYFDDLPFVLALPKHTARMQGELGGRTRLLKTSVARAVEQLTTNDTCLFEVHLLGMDSCSEAVSVAKEFPWVRSTDSARPVNYAIKGDPISFEDIGEGYRRPDNFFTQMLSHSNRALAHYNIEELSWVLSNT